MRGFSHHNSMLIVIISPKTSLKTNPTIYSQFIPFSRALDTAVQSTLIISKSKGPSKTLRDIRTSTYQICSIEEKQFEQLNK